MNFLIPFVLTATLMDVVDARPMQLTGIFADDGELVALYNAQGQELPHSWRREKQEPKQVVVEAMLPLWMAQAFVGASIVILAVCCILLGSILGRRRTIIEREVYERAARPRAPGAVRVE